MPQWMQMKFLQHREILARNSLVTLTVVRNHFHIFGASYRYSYHDSNSRFENIVHLILDRLQKFVGTSFSCFPSIKLSQQYSPTTAVTPRYTKKSPPPTTLILVHFSYRHPCRLWRLHFPFLIE